MKILIMGFAKIKYMPYLHFYLNNIDCEKNDVHLLYWNRDLADEPLEQFDKLTLHEFRLYQEDDVSPVKKIVGFLKYQQFASKILKQSFDRVIALHTFPGILNLDRLKKHYRGRYIFDYRDKTYEGLGFFKKWIAQLVEYSCASFVSSDGFREVLPDSPKLHTSHNLSVEDLPLRQGLIPGGNPNERIRLGFWGFIRNEETNRILIEKIAADPRFELHYYGREQAIAKNLKAYAATLTDRVFFHGEYQPKDRRSFVADTDLIHNIYEHGNMTAAMANKYYDGALFRLPQICMPDSYMGRRAEEAEIGFCCDPAAEDFTQQVYSYFTNLDREAFDRRCEAELAHILEEYNNGCAIIRKMTTKEAEA